VLPLAAPGLLARALCFTLSWNEFLVRADLIADDNLRTCARGPLEFVVSTSLLGQLMAAAASRRFPWSRYIYLHKTW